MSLVPGGAKQKGASGELELAALLEGWGKGYNLKLTRNLEQTRSGGHDLDGVPGLSIECKRVEALDVSAWWKQCTRQADAIGAVPFLAYRQNRKKWKFRVRTYVAYYGPAASGTSLLDVDLDENAAELWFQGHLRSHIEK